MLTPARVRITSARPRRGLGRAAVGGAARPGADLPREARPRDRAERCRRRRRPHRARGGPAARRAARPAGGDRQPPRRGRHRSRPQADGLGAPDGHTLMVATNAHAIAAVPVHSRCPTIRSRDFAPVVTLGAFPIALVVPPDSPLRTAGDLLARMRREPGAVEHRHHQRRQHAAPRGRAVQDAGRRRARRRSPSPRPRRSSPPCSGATWTRPSRSPGRSGARSRAASCGPSPSPPAERAANLPQVPTLRESGLPDYDVSSWNALVAPARTPGSRSRR